MFVGHYAAAFAAKAAEPRAPLWTYVGACQLMDIGWSGLVAAGVEKFRVDPSLPGSGLDLYFMPYTHSLPGSLALSAAALLAALVFRMPWRAALFIGLTVFSHWLLDLLVHRPDLLLWFGGPKVGLGFWNDPIPEMALEIGLVAVFGAAWVAQRKDQSLKAWPAIAFIAGLVALQIYASMPGGGTTGETDAATTTAMALAAYLVVTGLAWLVERGQAAALKPAAALSAG